MTRSFITITKFWHNPQVQILITDEGMGIRMGIDDFKKAVKEEMGKGADLDGAVSKVIDGIKEESRKVV